MNIRAGQSRRRTYRMVARADAAEATGERILEAARQLFSELLYDQVSLRQVADRAGVTVQTVIRRFDSKESLFAAVAQRRSSQIRDQRDQVPAGDGDAAVRIVIDSYERWGDEQLHLMAQERRTETMAAAVASGRRYHRAWIERVFAPWLWGLPAQQRKRRTAELVAVTDLYTWRIFRRDLGLSRDETEAAVRDLVERLTTAAGESQRR
jgi:AcrR family transcriptional regulator